MADILIRIPLSLKYLDVIFAGILNSLIGISTGYGHIQSSNSQLGRQEFADSIADYLAGIDINDHSQVNKAEKNADIGDIRAPELIDADSVKFQ